MEIIKINPLKKSESINEIWSPKIIGELNNQQVKITNIEGEFVWHKHENEDELFYVLDGSFEMHLRDKIIEIFTGELIIIPKGVEHKPVATNRATIMLFEPKTTINTGNQINDFTKYDLDLA